MIVELFGSPGAGKTTFARTLSARLRDSGYTTEPILSLRPAEATWSGSSAKDIINPWNSATAVTRRVTKPAVELLGIALSSFVNSESADNGLAKLLTIIPPKRLLQSMRERQYLRRLWRSWHRATRNNKVVIVDQGFVQIIHGLVMHVEADDETLISRALDCIPKADLLIRLSAPEEILEKRLRERRFRQGRIERLLERDIQANIGSIRTMDRLENILRNRGYSVTNVKAVNQHTLFANVEKIAAAIIAKFEEDEMQRNVGGVSGSLNSAWPR
jgi:broad-specificity NMP kinase